MLVEEKIDMISNFHDDMWMRQCAITFLERVSLNESYLDLVLEIRQNERTINLANIFKSIRNSDAKDVKKK